MKKRKRVKFTLPTNDGPQVGGISVKRRKALTFKLRV
jgi:hypothetical protein